MSYSPDKLNALACAVGVWSSFLDRTTGITYEADDKSKQAILKSLGFLADTDAHIDASFLKLQQEKYATLIDNTFVVTMAEQEDFFFSIRIKEKDVPSSIKWQIITEQGEIFEDEVALVHLEKMQEQVGDEIYHTYTLGLTLALEMGYHHLSIELKGKGIKENASLIVVPEKCYMPDVLEGDKKVFGYPIQLYSLKSQNNWGIGDYTDLKKLVDVAIKTGASFIGVNPLTALFFDNPDDASPYFPNSRLFLNPLYVDMEAILEAKDNQDFEELKECKIFQSHLKMARDGTQVDYQKVAAIKKQAFKILFKKFREDNFNDEGTALTKRGQAFDAFVQEKGQALESFAVFQTLRNHASKNKTSMMWREWQKDFQNPNNEAVKSFVKDNEMSILRIYYQQFVAFEQFESVLKKIEKLPLGLYTDMPVGVSDNSAEVWSNQDVFMQGVTTGAPPDTFNLNGQDWSLAPFHPKTLQKTGFKAFVDVIKSAMKGAGAVRIDHAFGLMRLYLRVQGATGAYLTYPFKELTGIMALESHRNKTVVIAEDLGTAPDGFSEAMMGLNAFSFKIMHYQQDWQGLMEPQMYAPCSLIATGTHDLPTYVGFFKGLDLELGLEKKTISPEQYQAHKENRKREKQLFFEAFEKQSFDMNLTKEDFVANNQVPDFFIPYIYAYLAKTKSKILLVRPEDIFEMEEQFNLPGTYMEHPNWRYKLPVMLEDMVKDKRLKKVVEILKEERVVK